MKFISALISLVLVLNSNLPARANEITLTETDVKNAKLLYRAWQDINNYKFSNGPIKLSTKSSTDIDPRYLNEFIRGVNDVVTKFSGYLSINDEFHIIMATNQSDAIKFIEETATEFPDYAEYKTSHINRAISFFSDSGSFFVGGSTSSRGCWFRGSNYGFEVNGTFQYCPKLNGGVVYAFAKPTGLIEMYGNLDALGGHEAFHNISSIINPMSHWNTSEWVIEGSMQAIGLAASTNGKNLKESGTILFPYPYFRESRPFDLAVIDHDPNSPERYSVGPLAIAYLIGRTNFDQYMNFFSKMGYPNKGQEQLKEFFGFSKEKFYRDFREYSEWYYTRGESILKNMNFDTWELEKTNKNKNKKKGKQKILFSCISKDGTTIKEFKEIKVKCPRGFKQL